VENVSILKDELQAARTEIREKEREMSLILRTAQNRESEEVQSLTAELAATNSRESEWNSYKGRLEEELETLKRENAALKETLSGLNPA
jgi:chromosome segregation ATPase